jgi:hypothetical protein
MDETHCKEKEKEIHQGTRKALPYLKRMHIFGLATVQVQKPSSFGGIFLQCVDKNLEPFIINVPIKVAIPCLEATNHFDH